MIENLLAALYFPQSVKIHDARDNLQKIPQWSAKHLSARRGDDSMNRGNAKPFTELAERLRFETLLADLSSQFVNLPHREMGREIMDGQGPSASFTTSISWFSGNVPKAFQAPRDDQAKQAKGSRK